MSSLTFDQYEQKVVSTEIYHQSISTFIESLNIPQKEDQQRLHKLLSKLYCTLGMIGEAGEIAEKMKKIIRDKNCVIGEEDTILLQKEGGDVLWYVAADAKENGTTLAGVANQNIEKLESRQKRGVLSGSGDNR